MISLPTPEILYYHLGDGSVEPVYLWQEDSDSEGSSVVIIHDLWEDISFYRQDIAWWMEKKYQVYGVNIPYFGTKKRAHYAGSFEKVCYNVLQILALIRSRQSMIAPLVYTRGVGALVTTRIARKNSKFLSGMIAFGPLFSLRAPPRGYQDYLIQALRAFSPDMRIPRLLMPKLSEQSYMSSLKKREDVFSAPGFPAQKDKMWREEFDLYATSELERVLSSFPQKGLADASITPRALQEYLKVMRSATRICSRLKVPCLFFLPPYSDHLDYKVLYQVQKKFGAMMRFEIQRVPSFYQIIQPDPSEEFITLTQKYLIPWLDSHKASLQDRRLEAEKSQPDSDESPQHLEGVQEMQGMQDIVSMEDSAADFDDLISTLSSQIPEQGSVEDSGL